MFLLNLFMIYLVQFSSLFCFVYLPLVNCVVKGVALSSTSWFPLEVLEQKSAEQRSRDVQPKHTTQLRFPVSATATEALEECLLSMHGFNQFLVIGDIEIQCFWQTTLNILAGTYFTQDSLREVTSDFYIYIAMWDNVGFHIWVL